MNKNINVINTLAHTLSISDLTEAIQILVSARKERQEGNLLVMKSVLAPGDTVEFYVGRRGQYVRGTVEKAKTKKAFVIEEGSGLRWDVPMGMLKKC
tara:strand:+ start:3109 stop:3399 length:291 start_codon:yes stop_codon:yes gene_type:complete